MTIGEKIKELREAKGWSKRKLAEEISNNYNIVRNWEVGRNEPTIYYCIKLADVFNITLDELCGRESRVRDNESL